LRTRIAATLTIAIAMNSVAALDARAQTPSSTAPSVYDRAWKFAEWYRNDKNPAVQSVLFSGRFQYEYADVDADQGRHSEWNVRRLRLGARATMFRSLTLHGEAEFNPQEHDPFYLRLTDLYVQWRKNRAFAIKVGKQAAEFTVEGDTSSKELITIDRSNLANNLWFPQEYMPGVSVLGERGRWSYVAGVFSPGTANRELGRFDGSAFTLLTLERDFSAALEAKEARVTAGYVYQSPDRANTFTRQLQHIVSLNGRYEKNRLGLRADVTAGQGYLGQSDLWGVVVMPFVNLTPKLQAVVRGTFLRSDRANGIRLAAYETRVVGGRGDAYDELYLGANYYFYGHKLKLQSGLQLAEMDDRAGDGGAYSGVSWTTGVRVSW
jgi:phosphate-selective porin OprO/OprP